MKRKIGDWIYEHPVTGVALFFLSAILVSALIVFSVVVPETERENTPPSEPAAGAETIFLKTEKTLEDGCKILKFYDTSVSKNIWVYKCPGLAPAITN